MEISIGNILILAIASLLITESDAWLNRNPFRSLLQRLNGRRKNPNRAPPPLTTSPTVHRLKSTTPYSCEPTYGYDPDTNWCYGTFCNEDGELLAWDNWNCKPTTTPSTTPPPTTTPVGCYYSGRYYPPGKIIERGRSRASNWCWVVFCDNSGHIQHGDDFNCFPTSKPTTTPPPPTTTPM